MISPRDIEYSGSVIPPESPIESSMSASANPSSRIASMDQFRGYTVAGMFVVNFLSSFAVIHPLLKHNNNYFSYADSIMPSFLFAVGFSFRLTYLRRIGQSGYWPTVWTYVRRSLALVVVSLVMYGFGSEFKHWSDFSQMPAEFEPFRPKATRTRSFDALISEARKDKPQADERTILAQAAAIGAASDDPRFRHAADVADREAAEFVMPAARRIDNWQALSPNQKMLVHLQIAAAKLLKSDLWETLAIIGATQLVVLPFIGWSFLARFSVLVTLGIAHLLMSYWFNWDFLYAINDNWLSKATMTGASRSWDGGFFGSLCWAIAMLAGTLSYDLVIGAPSRIAGAGRLMAWGIAFMAAGYAMSCVTRLYEDSPEELEARRVQVLRQQAEKDWLEILRRRALGGQRGRRRRGETQATSRIEPDVQAKLQVLDDQREAYPDLNFAASPVLPAWERLKGRTWRELLAEPPFLAPPRDDPRDDPQPSLEHRTWNYWMLGKRMPNLSFMTFASGFAFALYGVFVIACDLGGLSVGIFRTFGMNALAAYFLHHVIEDQVKKLVPDDAQLWYCLCGFGLFFLLSYACVRYLEKHKIYVRL
jgi:predicted acyltransferase